MKRYHSMQDIEARKNELLPDEIQEQFPKLYETDGMGLMAIAIVKFFTLDANWTWYAIEFDGEDIFFGLVDGFEKELGYFSLHELASIKGKFGLPVERDETFESESLENLKNNKTS